MAPAMAMIIITVMFNPGGSLGTLPPVLADATGPVGAGVLEMAWTPIASDAFDVTVAVLARVISGNMMVDAIGAVRNNVSISPAPMQSGSTKTGSSAPTVGKIFRSWHCKGPLPGSWISQVIPTGETGRNYQSEDAPSLYITALFLQAVAIAHSEDVEAQQAAKLDDMKNTWPLGQLIGLADNYHQLFVS
ncbi:hypothetical protein GGR54DRAFT_644583 [Hypoxylon sp. NC1633]|nr:hypothetical protein GGR54DRAFT_644583 [Hypoxylon sp. NC1633]